MFKRIIALAACLCMTVSLAACGKSMEEIPEESISPEAEESSAEDFVESEEESLEEDMDDKAEYDAVSGIYTFSSGAGAWSTEITVKEDGSFDGLYYDADMGDTGEGYENGTVYQCNFTGFFKNLVKEGDYLYKASVDILETITKDGDEEIIDQIRYVYTVPYGFENASEVEFYLPGMPIDEVPETYLGWTLPAMGLYDYSLLEHLPFKGMYNVNDSQGFFSDVVPEFEGEITDALNAMYESWEESAAEESDVDDGREYVSANDIGMADFLNYEEGGPSCRFISIDGDTLTYERNHMVAGDDGYDISPDGQASALINENTRFYIGDSQTFGDLYWGSGEESAMDVKWIYEVDRNTFEVSMDGWFYANQVIVENGVLIAAIGGLQVAG